MSDDEVDHELLELLRQSLLGPKPQLDDIGTDTKVLRHAEFIYDNSIDVNVDARGTRAAAQLIWKQMQERSYSTETWSEHDLHPKAKDEATLNFIFVMDLLNFSFWSEKPENERYAVEYRGKTWTGYWSLVACLQRALEEGRFFLSFLSYMQRSSRLLDLQETLVKIIVSCSYSITDIPITTPSFYADEAECPDEKLAHVFRSSTGEEIPLLQERIQCLREAGQVLKDVSFRSLCAPHPLTLYRNMTAALPTSSKQPTTALANSSTSSLTTSHASVMNPYSRSVRFAS